MAAEARPADFSPAEDYSRWCAEHLDRGNVLLAPGAFSVAANDREFQKCCEKRRWEFGPGAVWAVYADMVSHAVLSGQYAMEQTFLVSLSAMLDPARRPAGVLERLCGARVTSDDAARHFLPSFCSRFRPQPQFSGWAMRPARISG